MAGFEQAIKDGSFPKTVMAFVKPMKPQASYFVAGGGERTACFFFDLKDPSMIPSVAEPLFMSLCASIDMAPALNLEDMKAGIAKAMK